MVYTEIPNSKNVVRLVMDPIRPTKKLHFFDQAWADPWRTLCYTTIKIYVIRNVTPKNKNSMQNWQHQQKWPLSSWKNVKTYFVENRVRSEGWS